MATADGCTKIRLVVDCDADSVSTRLDNLNDFNVNDTRSFEEAIYLMTITEIYLHSQPSRGINCEW